MLKLTDGKSEYYTTGCLIDYSYYDWQQIEFDYKLDADLGVKILTVLEKEKETVLEFSKGTVKVY